MSKTLFLKYKCVHVFAHVVRAPVFFGIFKVLLVVSGLQEVALNDPDDPDSCPLT